MQSCYDWGITTSSDGFCCHNALRHFQARRPKARPYAKGLAILFARTRMNCDNKTDRLVSITIIAWNFISPYGCILLLKKEYGARRRDQLRVLLALSRHVLCLSDGNRPISLIPQCTCPMSHNAPMKLKCAYFCAEWCIEGYGTCALWDLRIWSIIASQMSRDAGEWSTTWDDLGLGVVNAIPPQWNMYTMNQWHWKSCCSFLHQWAIKSHWHGASY